MRTSILCAAILGLFAAGCAGELSGTGGDDTGGDDVPGICGDGAVNAGETCDDGNTIDGDGCSSTCGTEQATPRVALTVDKPTVTTDLLVSNEVTVTLTAMNGFSGDVTLAAEVIDGAGAPITEWTAALSTTTVNVPVDGTASATLALRVPGDAAELAGSVKISASSSAEPQEATVAVTANPVVKVVYTTNGNSCVYPTDFPLTSPIRIKVGRQLSVVNGSDPAGTGCGGSPCRMQIHMDGGIAGISHQNGLMAPGAAYTQTVNSENSTGITFYCHDANAAADQALDTTPQSTRQRLISVP